MSNFGSSSLPNNLIVSSVNYVTGSTGPTGPTGLTGFSLTGPTGADGIQFVSAKITGYTLGITYTSSNYFQVGVTAPAGSSNRIANPGFVVSFTGSSESDSHLIFSGISSGDPYLFLFKKINVIGEATAGISLDSFYISSPSTVGSSVGKTGSLLFVSVGSGGFGQVIAPTPDSLTRYKSDIITPLAGSKFGITLDTFRFKQSKDFTTEFKENSVVNLNWINASNVSQTLNTYGITYSFTSSQNNRTDQGIFITVKDSDNNIYPKLSFMVEGITLGPLGTETGTGPYVVNAIGKGITYSDQTYKASVIGSCCYCSKDETTENESTFERSCIDYASQEFCENIRGSFSFSSCNERYISGDCYSGGACCVNGVCLETNKELCEKVYGKFYGNIRCSQLPEGCPDSCIVESASCCLAGVCYEVTPDVNGERICANLGGSYSAEEPCEDRNCCVDGFLGACCFGSDECKDNYTPTQCTEEGGVYQGPTSLCVSSECCKDSTTETRSVGLKTAAQGELPQNIKVGDYFGGGIVAGFVGYPPPPGFDSDGYFAKGEVISEVENIVIGGVKRYVAVNGVYNSSLGCNCSNFSPSRYINISDLGKSSGKALVSNVKSLSGFADQYKLSFYNRLSDVCFYDEGVPCNFSTPENKKYGYNSILAYKALSNKIHGENIPKAWILIVAPEDFGTNVSFGMSPSVDGFATPTNFENYGEYLWQNNVLSPYGTTVFDGLLNTRMFDETSIERNNWFIASNYTVSGKLITADPLAYHRFKHTKLSYWQSEIDETLITTSPDYFKIKYREMWNAINDSTTALYQVSNKNKLGYNGYSDWYIPSALELNIIYYNFEKINKGLILSGYPSNRTIERSANYWSSTTGGKVLNIKTPTTGVFGTKTFENVNTSLENKFVSNDPLMDTWKNYKAVMAHRAYTQNFSNGKMESKLKSSEFANLRACRMIPIYFKDKNLQNQFEYSFKNLNTCTTCR